MRLCNPYRRHAGFGFRVLRARCALERFGRDSEATPYCRSFDDCFEMDDGDAVVWALMHRAIRNTAAGNPLLERGIRNLGDAVWSDWLEVYRPPRPAQLVLPGLRSGAR